MEIVANEYLGYGEEPHSVDKLVNMTCKCCCGNTATSPTCQMSGMAFSVGKKIFWIFMSIPIHTVMVLGVPAIRDWWLPSFPLIFSGKICREGKLQITILPWKAHFHVADCHWAQVYFNARGTSIMADFGKNVFCFLWFLLKCQRLFTFHLQSWVNDNTCLIKFKSCEH